MIVARPKRGESEEEILENEREFLSKKQQNKDFQPAAKLVNPNKHKNVEICHGEPKHRKFSEQNDETEPSTAIEEMEDDKVYFPRPTDLVLGDIVEKNVTKLSLSKPSSSASQKSISSGSTSIFAQRMREKRNQSIKTEVKPLVQSTSFSSKSIPDSSLIVKGDNAMEIHLKNKSILESMSEQEILEEREKLMATVDPKLLNYIRSLKGKDSVKVKVNIEDHEMMESIPENTTPLLNCDDNDVLSHPEFPKWLHFDSLENDKLEWMKNLKPLNHQRIGDEPYEARFDFKGYLLPYSIEYNEDTKTLFHHGEEPHRPGYTLNELFQLCRSSVIQQRSLALNTIAGLLEYNNLGIYNEIIDVPITKIFFVLRFAADENVPSVLEPTLKGLRNMLYDRVDEANLDSLLGLESGLLQPRIQADKIETEETDTDASEMKDFHLADLDLISGALRTDILARIRYILSAVKPGYLCTEYCLQILIRIARDSQENAKKLLEVDGLMEFICKEFIPRVVAQKGSSKSNSEHFKLIIHALKLIRVLISQSRTFAETCKSKYKILDSVLNYVNMTTDTIYLMKIQAEAFYLLSLYIKYGIESNRIESTILFVLNILKNHVNRIDMSASFSNIHFVHATSVLTLLSNIALHQSKISIVVNHDWVRHMDKFLVQGITKWCSQLCNMQIYSNFKLNLLSATFTCFNMLSEFGIQRDSQESITVKAAVSSMISSQIFLKITNNLMKCSNLLSSHQVSHIFKASNIQSLHSVLLDSPHKLQPILDEQSPFSFVSTICRYLLLNKNVDLSSYFLKIEGILKYVLAIQSLKSVNFTDSWFTKIELETLFNVIRLSTKLNCSEAQKSIVYNIAFKLSYILTTAFRAELFFLFQNVIFNKDWFSTDSLLKNLSIVDSGNIINDLNTIMECYVYSLKLKSVESLSDLTTSYWNQTILPRDWIYMPILGLYTKNYDEQNLEVANKKAQNEILIKNIVSCSMKWILVSEMYFPDITNEIGLTDRFCRLLCIFLCDNSLFLDPDIKPLLHSCVKIIFDLEKKLSPPMKLDFDKPLLGIANFQDLYMQLVDQYQAVSYSDPIFAACVLVPLSQNHNIKWRKIVWSEYAACLRSLDCPEELLCYNLDTYLNPPETDMSLLISYHRALNSSLLRPGTISYKIAYQHVEFAKNRSKKTIDSM